jgi:hypothetical protein
MIKLLFNSYLIIYNCYYYFNLILYCDHCFHIKHYCNNEVNLSILNINGIFEIINKSTYRYIM